MVKDKKKPVGPSGVPYNRVALDSAIKSNRRRKTTKPEKEHLSALSDIHDAIVSTGCAVTVEPKFPHAAMKYPSKGKLSPSGVIDPTLSLLETIHANFPKSVSRIAEANSQESDRVAISRTLGEKQYLNGIVSGLLNVMEDAITAGNYTDATRFAFEAGILWGMLNQTDTRRIATAAKRSRDIANAAKTNNTDLEREKTRRRYQVLMSLPGAERENTLRKMASGAGGTKTKLAEDLILEQNCDGVMEQVPKWKGLTTIRKWTEGL